MEALTVSLVNRLPTVATAGGVEQRGERRAAPPHRFVLACRAQRTIAPVNLRGRFGAVDREDTTVVTRLPAWSGKRKKLNNIIYLRHFSTPTCSSQRNKN